MNNEKKIQVNPITIIILIVVLVFIILLGITFYNLFRSNPYGREIKIDNFTDDMREYMSAKLYDIVMDNVNNMSEKDIPKSGAMIRNGSATSSYDEALNMHYGKYIVDIKDVRRTFIGYFEWSDDKDNLNYSGVSTVYYCPGIQDIIYEDFNCKDMFTDDLSSKFPIISYLPETVEYYSDNYSSYTKYRIAYLLLDDNSRIVLTITDYTGGNQEKALEKIKELGFNPNDYEIEYKLEMDYGNWVNAGDD